MDELVLWQIYPVSTVTNLRPRCNRIADFALEHILNQCSIPIYVARKPSQASDCDSL
jgi:hypothetical protein